MNGMNVTKSGRWMTDVFNDVFDQAQTLFKCRQMGNLTGFLKEMARMRGALGIRLAEGHKAPGKEICERCNHWKRRGREHVCHCAEGRNYNVQTGAAWTCTEFTPRNEW